jgi:hypothetical protein
MHKKLLAAALHGGCRCCHNLSWPFTTTIMLATLLEQFSIGAKKLFIQKKYVQSTSTMDGNVILLTDLIDRKDEAVMACVDAMITCGWTLVILPDNIHKQHSRQHLPINALPFLFLPS